MTGWMRHKPLVSALMLVCATSGQAGENETQTTSTVEEFLLFLGDWDDEQGNWQDPLEYSGSEWAELDTGQVSNESDEE